MSVDSHIGVATAPGEIELTRMSTTGADRRAGDCLQRRYHWIECRLHQIRSTTTDFFCTDFPFTSLISVWGKTQTGRDTPASTAKPVRTLCRFSTVSISSGN